MAAGASRYWSGRDVGIPSQRLEKPGAANEAPVHVRHVGGVPPRGVHPPARGRPERAGRRTPEQQPHNGPVRDVHGRSIQQLLGVIAGDHALHNGRDRDAADDGRHPAPAGARQRRRDGAAEDHAVHPLPHACAGAHTVRRDGLVLPLGTGRRGARRYQPHRDTRRHRYPHGRRDAHHVVRRAHKPEGPRQRYLAHHNGLDPLAGAVGHHGAQGERRRAYRGHPRASGRHDRRRHRVRQRRPAQDPHNLRQTAGRAQDEPGRDHVPAPQGQHGRGDPHNLRLLATALPRRAGATLRGGGPRLDPRSSRGLLRSRERALPVPLRASHHHVHLLLHGGTVQPRRARRQPEEERRLRPRLQAGPTHGHLPEQRADQDHALRRRVPGRHRRAALPDRPGTGPGQPALPRRHLHADRGRRLAGHGAPAGEPADDAQLRRVLEEAMRIILLGPQGAGKGTQAQRLAQEVGATHISTGDIVRAEIKSGSELGKKVQAYNDRGELVPDEIIVEMAKPYLDDADSWLLDGFPRNEAQAKALDQALQDIGEDLDAVVALDAPDDALVERLSGRRQSQATGKIYHVEYDPPPEDDPGPFVQRDDDAEEAIRRRLEIYHDQTEPLKDYYADRDLLITVDAEQEIPKVTRDILGAVGREEDA